MRAGLTHKPGSAKSGSTDTTWSGQPRSRARTSSHTTSSTRPQRPIGNQATLRGVRSRSAERPVLGVSTATATIDHHADGVITQTQAGSGAPGPVPAPHDDCHIDSAGFTAIPSGPVAATLSGSTLGAALTMVADFAPTIPCTCSCGEYRQYVRGSFTANGKNVPHALGGGRTLDPTTFQEDGDVAAGTVYGHRSVRGTKSKFKPDQATGCTFEGADEPGISSRSGVRLAMDLEFEGDLIDTCRGNNVLANSSWTVSGSATVP